MTSRRLKRSTDSKPDPVLFSSLPGLRPKDMDEKKARKIRVLERNAKKKSIRKQRAADRRAEKKRARRAVSQERQVSKRRTQPSCDKILFPFTMISKIAEWKPRLGPAHISQLINEPRQIHSHTSERKDSLSPQSYHKKTDRSHNADSTITPTHKPITIAAREQQASSTRTAGHNPDTSNLPTSIPIEYDNVNSAGYPGSKKSETCYCPTINGLCRHSLLPVGGVYHPVMVLKAHGPKGKMLEAMFQRKKPAFRLNGRCEGENQDHPDTLYLQKSCEDQNPSDIHSAKIIANTCMNTMGDLNYKANISDGNQNGSLTCIINEGGAVDPRTPSRLKVKRRKRSPAGAETPGQHAGPAADEVSFEERNEDGISQEYTATSTNSNKSRKRKHREEHVFPTLPKSSSKCPSSAKVLDEQHSPVNPKKSTKESHKKPRVLKKLRKSSCNIASCETSAEQAQGTGYATLLGEVADISRNDMNATSSQQLEDDDRAQTREAISFILKAISSQPPQNPATPKQVVLKGDSPVFVCKSETRCHDLQCSSTSSTFQCPVKAYSKEENTMSLLRNDWRPYYKFLCAKRKALNIRSHGNFSPPVIEMSTPGGPYLKPEYAPPVTCTNLQLPRLLERE